MTGVYIDPLLLQGEILLKSDPKDPPFQPPPLPDPSEEMFPGSEMVYLVISKYVAESASYAFWKAGQMNYNISTKEVLSKFSLVFVNCDFFSFRVFYKRQSFGAVL